MEVVNEFNVDKYAYKAMVDVINVEIDDYINDDANTKCEQLTALLKKIQNEYKLRKNFFYNTENKQNSKFFTLYCKKLRELLYAQKFYKNPKQETYEEYYSVNIPKEFEKLSIIAKKYYELIKGENFDIYKIFPFVENGLICVKKNKEEEFLQVAKLFKLKFNKDNSFRTGEECGSITKHVSQPEQYASRNLNLERELMILKRTQEFPERLDYLNKLEKIRNKVQGKLLTFKEQKRIELENASKREAEYFIMNLRNSVKLKKSIILDGSPEKFKMKVSQDLKGFSILIHQSLFEKQPDSKILQLIPNFNANVPFEHTSVLFYDYDEIQILKDITLTIFEENNITKQEQEMLKKSFTKYSFLILGQEIVIESGKKFVISKLNNSDKIVKLDLLERKINLNFDIYEKDDEETIIIYEKNNETSLVGLSKSEYEKSGLIMNILEDLGTKMIPLEKKYFEQVENLFNIFYETDKIDFNIYGHAQGFHEEDIDIIYISQDLADSFMVEQEEKIDVLYGAFSKEDLLRIIFTEHYLGIEGEKKEDLKNQLPNYLELLCNKDISQVIYKKNSQITSQFLRANDENLDEKKLKAENLAAFYQKYPALEIIEEYPVNLSKILRGCKDFKYFDISQNDLSSINFYFIDNGKIIQGNYNISDKFGKIIDDNFASQVTSLAIGQHHYVYKIGDKIFGAGSNHGGQLGFQFEKKKYQNSERLLINDNSESINIFCTLFHTFLHSQKTIQIYGKISNLFTHYIGTEYNLNRIYANKYDFGKNPNILINDAEGNVYLCKITIDGHTNEKLNKEGLRLHKNLGCTVNNRIFVVSEDANKLFVVLKNDVWDEDQHKYQCKLIHDFGGDEIVSIETFVDSTNSLYSYKVVEDIFLLIITKNNRIFCIREYVFEYYSGATLDQLPRRYLKEKIDVPEGYENYKISKICIYESKEENDYFVRKRFFLLFENGKTFSINRNLIVQPLDLYISSKIENDAINILSA